MKFTILGVILISLTGQNNAVSQAIIKNDEVVVREQSTVGKRQDNTEKKVRDAIERNAKALGSKNLQGKKFLNSDFEVRVWVDEEVLLHCLIIEKSNGIWRASIVTRQSNEGGLPDFNEGRRDLASPIDGWKNLTSFFVTQGVDFPFTFSWDKSSYVIQDPDEGAIVLELKRGKKYGYISYNRSSTSQGAKTIIDVCRYLENEFKVQVGCA